MDLMRKLIVFNIISLDGYHTGPGNNVMIMPMGGVFDAYTIERLRAAETTLLGRVSFEMLNSFWPNIANDPSPLTDCTRSAGSCTHCGCT